MEKEFDVWITTPNNPWSPFTQFESWFEFDTKTLGYFTCERVARRARLSEKNLTEYENNRMIMDAIDDVVDHDVLVDPFSGEEIRYRICTPADTVPW